MGKRMYAIAYKYQEDVFYDFEKEEDNFGLEMTCLLPTQALAEETIESTLSDEYMPLEITIESINRSGVWSYSFDPPAWWEM